jgi:hypothetical protein
MMPPTPLLDGFRGRGPVYFMLFYAPAGLWFGDTFAAIGLGISAPTLTGFFDIGEAFPLWMAFVSGGGLILGGLWMRRIRWPSSTTSSISRCG